MDVSCHTTFVSSLIFTRHFLLGDIWMPLLSFESERIIVDVRANVFIQTNCIQIPICIGIYPMVDYLSR